MLTAACRYKKKVSALTDYYGIVMTLKSLLRHHCSSKANNDNVSESSNCIGSCS